ncbi:hypothetical protein H4R99_002284 [Coemansia sp. RSA 1722]|nr:hypothetical protein IWW45_009131 [Coemansia sp. RSA 485]KAJ2603703.1 hypothetical protein H4R99_002284 [Coemansia sp. RSA 1722]KAJ2640143.1 hypothetical protein GGF40_000291 [Coemansia sp. RSA 1286]
MSYSKNTENASKQASPQNEKQSENAVTDTKDVDRNDQDGDEDDAWDQRIKTTGCFKENEALLICHADTGDWRKCLAEMNAFKRCMKRNGRFNEDS